MIKRIISKIIVSSSIIALIILIFLIGIQFQKSNSLIKAPFEKYLSTFEARVIKKSERHEFQKVVLQVPEHHKEKGAILLRGGELIIRPNAPATIILFHGFKCKRYQIRPLRTFLFSDYNAFLFDFRAHGSHVTDDQCCSFGVDEVSEVKAAVDFVRSHPQLKDKPIIAYGISMGAAAAIEAQSRYNNMLFDAMIVDSPFDSMEDVVCRGLYRFKYYVWGYDILEPLRIVVQRSLYNPVMDKILKTLLRMVGMDAFTVSTCLKPVSPVDSIKKITVPCLIIGCSSDEMVPASSFEKAYENAASNQKELWIVDGSGHVDTFSYKPEEYIQKVRGFMTRVLSDLRIKAWKTWLLGPE